MTNHPERRFVVIVVALKRRDHVVFFGREDFLGRLAVASARKVAPRVTDLSKPCMTQAALRLFVGISVFLAVLLGTSLGRTARATATLVPSSSRVSAGGTFLTGPISALRPIFDGDKLDAERQIPVRLRRLKKMEVTRAVALSARAIIHAHHAEPFGTEIPFESEGRQYVARIERHFHPPGGDKFPWGYHPGASILVPDRSMVESDAR